ncbi:MAG: class I tRNA ligase family protein [Patescibacteria group bacterium]
MPETLEPHYDHLKTEEKIYRLWEGSGYFSPDKLPSKKTAKPFTVMMPPPNANGSLHIGHAVGITLQDVMARFARMRGKKTLWLPGADHAGFETQVVFDKKLEKEGRNSDALHGRSSDTEGRRSRFTMSREELWKEIWDFTQTNKKVMENQLRKLGASCDWSREKFTLDPDIIKTVYETFERLYKDGLAYRDLRVVNWCPKHRTALSDLEVKYIEREDPLYYIKYGPLTLATVRPETKFGDTALAVNPKDKRYQKYIGKVIEARGILGPLKFKVIADDAIDPKFGTGVVKVTPAHDPLDFEIWQRHKNEISGPKVIIDESGRLTGEVGEFKGLKVSEARQKVSEAMEKIGILEKTDSHYKHQVATCYKCGNILEPLPKPQWFIRMTEKPRQVSSDKRQASGKSLRDLGIDAVKSGKIKIYPKRTEKVYMHWLKNIRDWNISRQIVWGIRIPAWFREISNIKDQRSKIWDLKIYDGRKTFEALKNGKKRVETRAGKPQGAEKDWRSFKIGDVINFSLVEEGTERILSNEVITKEIVSIHHFRTIDELLSKFDVNEIHPYHPTEYRSWWESRPIFKKRIKKYGIWAFELQDVNEKTQEIYVGIAPPSGEGWVQDPDVFDTWFSSGQWPFATLLANKKGDTRHVTRDMRRKSDFEEFYPTDVMATGYDILFFWVARMVMLGLYRTDKVPFKNVYLHGLVRDKDRQKMSKSKGNVVDPLGVAEMYGADALRMALVVGNTPGNDIAISEDKIRGYRNFATKIWNASRFVLMNRPSKMPKIIKLSAEDKKNIAGVIKAKAAVAKYIEKFEFHLAAEKAYHYFWHTFADKIIESYKPRLRGEEFFASGAAMRPSGHGLPQSGESEAESPVNIHARDVNGSQKQKILADQLAAYHTLETILLESLKMLHPFMPFVSEEIYGKLNPGKLLIIEKW